MTSLISSIRARSLLSAHLSDSIAGGSRTPTPFLFPLLISFPLSPSFLSFPFPLLFIIVSQYPIISIDFFFHFSQFFFVWLNSLIIWLTFKLTKWCRIIRLEPDNSGGPLSHEQQSWRHWITWDFISSVDVIGYFFGGFPLELKFSDFNQTNIIL